MLFNLLFAAIFATVSEILAPYVEKGELPGAISYFYDNGREELTLAGFADKKAARPMALDSTFMQCSQTKGFCGVTIAILIEEGKIDLDDPVSKYLPEFKTLWVEDKSTNADVRTFHKAQNVMTIRNVMNHTAGFPFEAPGKEGGYKGAGWTRGAPLRNNAAIAAAQPLLFEPGTKEKYSNTGIDVGAAIVEVVTGKKWEDFLKERVLDPLEMHDTSFWPTDEQLARAISIYEYKKDRAASYVYDYYRCQRPYNKDGVVASAGAGLWTTAADQIKFYKMLMNLGLGDNGVRILKEETVKKYLAVSTRPDKMDGYSMGLKAPKAADDNDEAWFGHGGALNTNCMVNYHKKQLKLWVVQGKSKPRPWDDQVAKYAEEFFNLNNNKAADASDFTGKENN